MDPVPARDIGEQQYILTQHPGGNTLTQFWTMVGQAGARLIVCLSLLPFPVCTYRGQAHRVVENFYFCLYVYGEFSIARMPQLLIPVLFVSSLGEESVRASPSLT